MIFFFLLAILVNSHSLPFDLTHNIFAAAFCSFQFAYFGAWLVEKLHEDINMYSERKTNLIVPYSFYVVFLLPLIFF